MQLKILGFLALTLIIFGTAGVVIGVTTNSDAGIAGIALRVGLILGALWIAYPQLVQVFRHSPKLIIGGLVVVGSVVAMGSRGLIIAVPVVAVLGVLEFIRWLFKPLPKKRKQNVERGTSGRGKE